MSTPLDRDDIISGLRDLVAVLQSAGESAGIRIVGGAALSLRYFDRRTTQDVDAIHLQPRSAEVVSSAAARVARSRGWDPSWVNFAVEKADALPHLGRAVEWHTIYVQDGVVVEVASKEALLAMKLRANRPGRDTNDIRQLLALCEVRSLNDAEQLYEDFYPGDALTDRAVRIVENLCAEGLPTSVTSPGAVDLS